VKNKNDLLVKCFRLEEDVYNSLLNLKEKSKYSWNEFLKNLVGGAENISLQPVKIMYDKCNTNVIHKPKEDQDENAMLKIFHQINPTILFGSKTLRAAVVRLYKVLGKEKALRAAEAAVQVFGQPYAPTIKDPLQLEKKLPELVSFYKRTQSKQIVEV
jgi:predicted CopG family antitoxin